MYFIILFDLYYGCVVSLTVTTLSVQLHTYASELSVRQLLKCICNKLYGKMRFFKTVDKIENKSFSALVWHGIC